MKQTVPMKDIQILEYVWENAQSMGSLLLALVLLIMLVLEPILW